MYLFHSRESFTEIKDGANKIYKYGSKSQILIFKIYTKIKRFLEKFVNDKRFANKLFYKIMTHYGIYWYYAHEKLKKCKQKNKFIYTSTFPVIRIWRLDFQECLELK